MVPIIRHKPKPKVYSAGASVWLVTDWAGTSTGSVANGKGQ